MYNSNNKLVISQKEKTKLVINRTSLISNKRTA